MKPIYEIIPELSKQSFTVRSIVRESRPLLSQAWHYHPEIEICFTKKSDGKRFVGNHISDYHENDLVLIGKNLPHGFTTDMPCDQVVIQMHEDFLGEKHYINPEFRSLQTLFYQAGRGLVFGKKTTDKAKKIIKKVVKKNGLTQMIHLLALLNLLAKAKDVDPICSEEYSLDFDPTHLERIKIVYDYIVVNIERSISVKEVADLLSLTEAAFYKFFKRHTKKTFTQVVNEFRVNMASKMLLGSEKPISQICFESGFNNVSYFNRKFKEIMHKTPNKFRETFK